MNRDTAVMSRLVTLKEIAANESSLQPSRHVEALLATKRRSAKEIQNDLHLAAANVHTHQTINRGLRLG